MFLSFAGLELLKGFEQCRLAPYWDAIGKVWTQGWGATGSDIGPDSPVWTQRQADTRLLSDSQFAVDEVNRVVTVALTQPEFDALVDFVFNCGAGALEHSTMLKLLNAGDYAGAAGQFDRWDKSKGVVVAGLLRRRVAETAEFNQGVST